MSKRTIIDYLNTIELIILDLKGTDSNASDRLEELYDNSFTSFTVEKALDHDWLFNKSDLLNFSLPNALQSGVLI